MKSELYKLNEAQHATVLAALRFYQQKGMGDPANRSAAIHAIATSGNITEPGLDAAAIDALCEDINHDGLDFSDMPGIFGVRHEDNPFAQAAYDNYQREGEVEIDSPTILSESDEGAYVMAWVWVSNEAAGVKPEGDEDEDACDACGEPSDGGDGWDGLCADCADLVAEDDEVAAWVKEHHGQDFHAASEDGQHDWRVAYIQAEKGIEA